MSLGTFFLQSFFPLIRECLMVLMALSISIYMFINENIIHLSGNLLRFTHLLACCQRHLLLLNFSLIHCPFQSEVMSLQLIIKKKIVIEPKINYFKSREAKLTPHLALQLSSQPQVLKRAPLRTQVSFDQSCNYYSFC